MISSQVDRVVQPSTFWLVCCLFMLCAIAGAGGRRLPAASEQRSRAKKVVFVAGNKSHGPGEHEYELGCRLLAHCLETSPNLKDFHTEVALHGWPDDPRTLDDADAIVVFCDGADHREANHPLLSDDRLDTLARQMNRGAGLVALHYTLFVPKQRGGPQFLDWLGGYFDFESGAGANHWYSKIQVAQTTATVASPDHPIARGVTSFPLRDEYYYHLRFREKDPQPVPILKVALPGEPEPETVAWAVQREGGGRGFAYSGGHFHANWQNENLRRMVLNAIVWAARGRVPVGGVRSTALPQASAAENVDWPNVGNDKGAMRYSPLAQIRRDNVKDLQVAWTYHTGDASGTTIECTPVVVDGVMYVTTAHVQVAALDAATGREIWRFNPRRLNAAQEYGGVNRGVAYWSDGKPEGERRILVDLSDGRLLSLDARAGEPDPHFGSGGFVDLRAGIERDIRRMEYGGTSSPAVWHDLVYVPITNSEEQPGAPGDIRAFDVRTGREVWRFHTVPRPGEFGNDTWEGDSWKERTGVNAWAGYTLDAERGILFAGLGSASSDYYGGDRHGANLFANCTLALDAATGKRLWHFQTLHHDLWDHDLPCPPTMVQVRRGGRHIDAVAQPTKTGYLFLFDRLTGKPLFPVEERPVPSSDVPGEQAYPTQPFPLKPPPFSRQFVGVDDLTNISPEANAYARSLFEKLRGGPANTPPSLQGTIVIPGFHGGANWSGASFDPTTGLLYVNSNNVPNVTTLVKTKEGYDHTGYFRFLDKEGYPAIKPPWGNLTAIDLNKGEFAWQVVLGEFPELKARGVPRTGTETFGGTIVTAGGLLFIGGTKDEKFHAFDKATGKLLWDYPLPAGGYATPCTYVVNGRQYVVIAAGGGGKLGTRSGDAFVAFALPAVDSAGATSYNDARSPGPR